MANTYSIYIFAAALALASCSMQDADTLRSEAVANAFAELALFVHTERVAMDRTFCGEGPIILGRASIEEPVPGLKVRAEAYAAAIPLPTRILDAEDDYDVHPERYSYADWEQLGEEDVLDLDIGTLERVERGWSMVVHTGCGFNDVRAEYMPRPYTGSLLMGYQGLRVVFDGETGEVFEIYDHGIAGHDEKRLR